MGLNKPLLAVTEKIVSPLPCARLMPGSPALPETVRKLPEKLELLAAKLP
jgi:hypothetical protein